MLPWLFSSRSSNHYRHVDLTPNGFVRKMFNVEKCMERWFHFKLISFNILPKACTCRLFVLTPKQVTRRTIVSTSLRFCSLKCHRHFCTPVGQFWHISSRTIIYGPSEAKLCTVLKKKKLYCFENCVLLQVE